MKNFFIVCFLSLTSFFHLNAESSQFNQDLILTLPTGEYKILDFVQKVEKLNPFLNIVSKGQPKSSKISFSSGSRFKTVFRNLSQFQQILIDAEISSGGTPQFDLLDDRLTIIWSKGGAVQPVAKSTKKESTPIRNLSEAYRINGKLVIDEYLKHDPKEPVVVDGEMIVKDSQIVEFGELTINGKLTLGKGSRVKAEKLTISGEVVVSDGATVETTDVVFDGDGDLILNEDSTLLLSDSTISTK